MISAWWLLLAAGLGIGIGMMLAALFAVSRDDPRQRRGLRVRPFEEDGVAGPSTVV